MDNFETSQLELNINSVSTYLECNYSDLDKAFELNTNIESDRSIELELNNLDSNTSEDMVTEVNKPINDELISQTAIDKYLVREHPPIIVDGSTQAVAVVNENPTISVLWDRAAQAAIEAKPVGANDGAPVSAYIFGKLHTVIYDAWSAYEGTPISSTTGSDALQRPERENTEANKIEAISYAAYQTLTDLLPGQEVIFQQLMLELGFDPHLQSSDPNTAIGIGTLSAIAAKEARRNDGSNYLGNDPNSNGTRFSDTSGYEIVNTPDHVRDIERFTPENTPVNEEPLLLKTAQVPLTPHFGQVDSFALEYNDQFRPKPPESFLVEGVDGEVNVKEKTITLADGTVLEISRDLIGSVINPEFILQAEEIINISANLTDKQKLIAEFWEDGPGSSFPPGNSLAFGQYVSARDNNTLDQDVELFFALGNSQLDAAIAAWDAKYAYNYPRPLRTVRELGRLGLIGEYDSEWGDYTMKAYAGKDYGTQKMLVEDFITYQFGETESSPPFPEYVSGHSTFSAAGAEVLKRHTGSDDFGATVTFEPGTSRFEPGQTPSEAITFEWDTFSEFADESGMSRLYGGIHFAQGNLEGGYLGKQVGATAYDQAQFFINGGNYHNELENILAIDVGNMELS